MAFYLKGITNPSLISKTQSLGISGYSFDLRPKSFNFTQLKKIKEMLEIAPNLSYTLLFENEKEMMVSSLHELLQDVSVTSLLSEFTGGHSPKKLEESGVDFIWHYQSEEKLKDLYHLKHLKRIVLSHKVLEEYNQRGELFGFLQLFSDLREQGVEFELQIDWDTALIESMFEYFQFDSLSWEVNNKVEISYQNPNVDLISSQIVQIQQLFI